MKSQLLHRSQTQARIYLDYNATAPILPGVVQTVAEALSLYGNPSSTHKEGRAAAARLQASRRRVAEAIGGQASEIVFTSGGTEANALGLLGFFRSSDKSRVVVPNTMHPSLAAAAEMSRTFGGITTTLPVGSTGAIHLDALKRELKVGDVAVVAFSLANHEVGTLEDARTICALAKDYGARVFGDAVQAFGRIPLDVSELGLDALSLSAHKVGGPKGVGALWVRDGVDVSPLVGGGGQESGRRPGTPATHSIVGFARAVEEIENRLADVVRQEDLLTYLIEELDQAGAHFVTPRNPAERLCNTLCVRWPGCPGEVIAASMDLAGIAISTGAACSSGTTAPSPVLLALGLTPVQAKEAIRISIGPQTTQDELYRFVECLVPILTRTRQF